MRFVTIAACCLALSLGAAPARAQLSPGPLQHSHAQLEGVENCTRCHEVGQKLSAQKCLACHTALDARVRAGKGLHATPGHEACETCHIEHQGRDYELIWWGKAGQRAFDHAQAGWRLEGKHATLACDRCHRPEALTDVAALQSGAANPRRTFLGLRTDCASCHHDPHDGKLGADCRSCHGVDAFRGAKSFDHARTAYPLTGRHAQVACAKCHPALPPAAATAKVAATAVAAADSAGSRQWKGLRFASCADCHQDPHQGRLGAQCASCHATENWRKVAQARFDHDRTRYPLRGEHVTVPCNGCHRPDRPARGLRFAACTDCHQDAHKGQFAARAGGGACDQCHTVAGYSPSTYTIEMHAVSRYPLAGGHLAVSCLGCHARPRAEAPVAEIPFRFASTRCVQCHRDPHQGEATPWIEKSGCESCHDVAAWAVAVYDHAATRFPLAGKHATVRCTACHKPLKDNAPRGAVKLRGVGLACESCHRDPHAGQFRDAVKGLTSCERCHTAANWRAERFEHNRDSVFKIEGAHARAVCVQCHPREGEGEAAFTRFKPIGRECSDCHRAKPGDATAPAIPAPAKEGTRK